MVSIEVTFDNGLFRRFPGVEVDSLTACKGSMDGQSFVYWGTERKVRHEAAFNMEHVLYLEVYPENDMED